MSIPDTWSLESLGVLFALLPGFITFLLVRSLTARGRRIQATEAVLHGLAYTLLAHAIWAVLTSVGSLIPTPDLVGLPLCAIALGLVLSWLATSGIVYNVLRKMRLTREAPWRSVWQSAFAEFRANVGEYAVLQFRDGRRLLGAIRGSSAQQSRGHVYLHRARWIHSDGDEPEQPGTILVNAGDISFVQFLPFPSETQDDRQSARTDDSAATPTTRTAAPAD